jgi:lysophospholipase L1-like esterase
MARSIIVRLVGSIIALLALTGCGEQSASPPRGPSVSAGASQPAARASAPSILRDVTPRAGAGQTGHIGQAGRPATAAVDAAKTTASVGRADVCLDGSGHLGRLFEGLARLEAGHGTDDVRIMQYGDSHTASDSGTSVFRRALQARFGDGGRGFVSLGKPWKTYWQEGLRGGMSAGFEPFKVQFKSGTYYGVDGCYGLLGVGVAASKEGERAWAEVQAVTSRLEVDYWQWPGGGSFDLSIDGARVGHVATKAQQAGSGYVAFEVAERPHQVELRTGGDGEVRVFGMVLDRAQAGVVVDALGINGAQVFTPLRWNEEHFVEQLRRRAPDLVIVAYGTNESLESKLSDEEYERGIVDFLGRVARAVPTASCLLLGPPDRAMYTGGPEGWGTAPRIVEIVGIQRRVAAAAGCAFYDQLQAMGGPGSMAAWAAEPEPRGFKDRMHLTRTGYAQLAMSFADELLRAYDARRVQRGSSVEHSQEKITAPGAVATPQTPEESRRSTSLR